MRKNLCNNCEMKSFERGQRTRSFSSIFLKEIKGQGLSSLSLLKVRGQGSFIHISSIPYSAESLKTILKVFWVHVQDNQCIYLFIITLASDLQ